MDASEESKAAVHPSLLLGPRNTRQDGGDMGDWYVTEHLMVYGGKSPCMFSGHPRKDEVVVDGVASSRLPTRETICDGSAMARQRRSCEERSTDDDDDDIRRLAVPARATIPPLRYFDDGCSVHKGDS